jgi:hypothetical protein
VFLIWTKIAAKKNGAAHTDATEATASTTAATTTTTTTTTTATANGAAEDKKENVFSLKTGKAGQKGKSRANAAQLRAQKGIAGSVCPLARHHAPELLFTLLLTCVVL